MANEIRTDILVPDEELNRLRAELMSASGSERKRISDAIAERKMAIARAFGVNSIGEAGFDQTLIPAYNPANKGKLILQPAGPAGLYTALKITEATDRNPYGIDTAVDAGGNKLYFDASGNPIDIMKAGEMLNAWSATGKGIGGGVPTSYTPGSEAATFYTSTTPSSASKSDTTPSSGSKSASTGYTGSGTAGDPLKFNDIPYTGLYLGMNFVSGISTASSAAKAERQSAYDALLIEFNKYGLGSLIKTVQGLIEKDVPPSQFIIELRNSPEYQQRFSANAERLKKGLAALSEAEYIRNEDNYRQILRTYGLTQFDNDAYVNQFLVNDVSPQELGERVVTAVNQIKMADPAITQTLKRYYGLNDSDMLGIILDPKTQLPQIQRTIAAAGIGTAAGRQGLNVGKDVAEQLAAQGVTQQEAERGYATIAEILPTAEKLSDIYGEQIGRYGLPEAEQEVFNQLASAQRKRQRLVERERAAFSGQSGVGRGSLSSPIGGQI